MTLMKTKSRKPPKGDAILACKIKEAAEGITHDEAVQWMSAVLDKRNYRGDKNEKKCVTMLRQMNTSLNKHYQHKSSVSMTEERRQECIRDLLIGTDNETSSERPAQLVFSIDKDRAYHNGYFVFRPKSEAMSEPIYRTFACLKVLADNNDGTYPSMVRFYRWIEKEMMKGTWY